MEQNQFLGGDSPDIEFLNEQEGSVPQIAQTGPMGIFLAGFDLNIV